MNPVALNSVFLKIARTTCIGITAVAVSGCSVFGLDDYFRDRSNDYRRAAEIEPLNIPVDLESQGVGELYPIPVGGEVVSYEIDDEFEVPRPRSVALNESDTLVKIQRLGGQDWILLASPPNQAWTRVRSYMTRNGIPTAKADLSTGTIETALFQLSDDNTRNQQFLISLAQGVQVNSTEIDIVQRSFDVNTSYEQLPSWESVSEDVAKKEWFRDGLAEYLADVNATGTASLVGQEVGAETKVEVIAVDGAYPYIRMRMPFQRAWASVGYALGKESAGFSKVEDDIETKFYVSNYSEVEEEKKGFFKRLFSSKPAVETYKVTLSEQNGIVSVSVAFADGSEMTERESFIVLQRIRNNLG